VIEVAEGDAEIEAMQAVVAALQGLEDEERARVMEWAAKRFNVPMSTGRPRAGKSSGNGLTDGERKFEHFAELLDAAGPTNDNTRALVGGYWFQVVNGGGTFTSGAANDELKNTGNRLPNITRSLDRLQALRPALVIQVGKSGSTKQARKTYKLTTAGISAVEAMIAGTGEEVPADGDEE
jgi:hypothetical protein